MKYESKHEKKEMSHKMKSSHKKGMHSAKGKMGLKATEGHKEKGMK